MNNFMKRLLKSKDPKRKLYPCGCVISIPKKSAVKLSPCCDHAEIIFTATDTAIETVVKQLQYSGV